MAASGEPHYHSPHMQIVRRLFLLGGLLSCLLCWCGLGLLCCGFLCHRNTFHDLETPSNLCSREHSMDAEYRGMVKWNRVENLRSGKFFPNFFCAHLARLEQLLCIVALHSRSCAHSQSCAHRVVQPSCAREASAGHHDNFFAWANHCHASRKVSSSGRR